MLAYIYNMLYVYSCLNIYAVYIYMLVYTYVYAVYMYVFGSQHTALSQSTVLVLHAPLTMNLCPLTHT